jgi:hypothetical protein
VNTQMKNQVFAALAVIIILTAFSINAGNASTQAFVTLPSSGTIASAGLSIFDSFENGLGAWEQSYIDNYVLQTTTAWAYNGANSLYSGTTTNDRYAKLSMDLGATYNTVYGSEIFKPVSWNIGNDRGAMFLGISQSDSNTSYLALLGVFSTNAGDGSVKFALRYKTSSGDNMISTTSIVPTIGNTYWLMLKVVRSSTVGEVRGYINGTDMLNATSLNNAMNSGDIVVNSGWMGINTQSDSVNRGYAYIDVFQASTNIISQPVYSYIYPPTALVVSKSGSYYQANDTSTNIWFGGASNAHDVNGLSFGDVVGNCTQSVSNVTVLAGNYVLDKIINLLSNNIITGQGNSTFIQQIAGVSDHEYGFFIDHVSNVTISHLWLDGNRALQTDTGDMMRHGVISMFSNDIWLHDLTITNFTETGFDSCWTTNSTIENCILAGSGDADIWIDISSSDFMVRNNTVSGLDGKSCLGIAAVFFDDDGNHTGTITNNTIIGNFTWYALELYWGSSVTKPYGVTVSNNTIIGGNGNGYQSGIWLYRMSNSTIEGNIIKNNTRSSNNGIMLSGCDHIVIKNNIINYNIGGGVCVSNEPNQYNTITLNDLRYNSQGAISDDVTQTQDIVSNNLG